MQPPGLQPPDVWTVHPHAPAPPPPPSPRSRAGLWAGLAAFLVVVLCGSVYVLTPRPAAALRPGPSAVATPTASNEPAASPTPSTAPATDGAIISRPPSALPTGQEKFGPSSRPVPWTALADNGSASVAVVPGGVTFTLDKGGVYNWLNAPVSTWYQNTRVAGDVRFVSGANNNGIGLGCASDDGTVVYAFFIHADQTWAIEKQGSAVLYPSTLASGVSTAIGPVTKTNHLALICSSSTPSAVVLMFAINGTPVADLTAPSEAKGWSPTANLCSCSGADTGQFTSVAQAAW